MEKRAHQRVGAIVSFVGGTHGTPAICLGHVAFVEKVQGIFGSFLVSETNYGATLTIPLENLMQIVPLVLPIIRNVEVYTSILAIFR